MRRLLPRTRMGVFTLLLVLLWILKSLFVSPQDRLGLSPAQRLSLDFLTLLLAVPAVYYGWRLLSHIRKKLLWKIRRRLILAHIFIGAIPILMVVVIVYVTALLFYYQLTYYLILNQVGLYTAQIHAFNLSLRASLEQVVAMNGPLPSAVNAALQQDGQYLLGSYPTAAAVLRIEDPRDNGIHVFGNQNVSPEAPSSYSIPGWTEDEEFSGLVLEDMQTEVYRAGDEGESRGRLFFRSLVFSDFRADMPFSIEISVPFDRSMLDRLYAAIGQDMVLAEHIEISGLNVMLQTTDLLRSNVLSSTFDLQVSQESVGRPVWSVLLFPTSWNSGGDASSTDAEVLFVELSTSKLLQNVFRSESNISRTILGVLQIVVGFFLLVEVISLVIGIVLTKSITNAVHNLYRGTEFVRRGDFSHRIVVRSEDQLGTLASSFNQMTEYVQDLVKERVKKERLERELEIAQEVQEQLFPRRAPRLQRMELTGLCLPARIVSGDYYDFLQFDADCVGLALGDICGKGISAALLMANLQATLRSNVIHLMRDSDLDGQAWLRDGAVARVVQRLNEQIYNHTAANKFASFFYGVYDETRTSLTYCNAGHNPPLYFNADGFRRLSTGGTVVGIFSDADFQQETVKLNSGDLILAYTDGIVESVNEYGEEFGERRLVKLVEECRSRSAEEIQKIIVDRVLAWAYEEERDDDMTLIVARIR